MTETCNEECELCSDSCSFLVGVEHEHHLCSDDALEQCRVCSHDFTDEEALVHFEARPRPGAVEEILDGYKCKECGTEIHI